MVKKIGKGIRHKTISLYERDVENLENLIILIADIFRRSKRKLRQRRIYIEDMTLLQLVQFTFDTYIQMKISEFLHKE